MQEIRTALMVCLVVGLPASLACAQVPLNQRVLVVYNANERDSKDVASYYMAKRAIPPANKCRIAVSSADQIKQDEFDSSVRRPVRKCLDQLGKDNILYIVFSYKTPWLLEVGPQTYALDQFVADIWDEFLPERPANMGEAQPYFGAAQSEGDVYQPFVSLADYRQQPGARRIYSVWRLDAATPTVAKALVDKALFAEAHGLSGNACFDCRTDPLNSVADFGYGAGDWDIHQAAEMARRAGFPVIEDAHAEEFGTAPAPLRCDHAALYAGWYTLNHYNDAFTWNPGAIGIHLDSASATNPRGGANWAANAIARGITITAGAITEPYLDNLPHPDQALWYLFHGANAADALLRSERLLKWRIINIGDPLYRPFSETSDLAARVTPPILFALLPKITLADSTSAAVIALSKPASASLTFSVKSERPDLVNVPQNITVQAGANGIKFPIHTLRVSANESTVRLQVTGHDLQISNTLVLVPLLASLNISPDRVKGGSSALATVFFRRTVSDEDATVTLKSGNPALASIPSQIAVLKGQSKASFPIATHPVVAQTSIAISAAFDGMVQNRTLIIVP